MHVSICTNLFFYISSTEIRTEREMSTFMQDEEWNADTQHVKYMNLKSP